MFWKKKNEEYFINKGKECSKNNEYEKAIKINPNCWIAYNNIGLCYKEQGNYDKALDFCNKTIEINSNSPIPYNNRGKLYGDIKKYDEAIARTR